MLGHSQNSVSTEVFGPQYVHKGAKGLPCMGLCTYHLQSEGLGKVRHERPKQACMYHALKAMWSSEYTTVAEASYIQSEWLGAVRHRRPKQACEQHTSETLRSSETYHCSRGYLPTE